ncbi:MAG TPA: ADP-ribosylglycohydrolase family protein [Polyangiaceae bacterium]
MMNAIERARLSLEGLSVGDAFGERFMGPPHRIVSFIARRAEPGGVWRWTDDTAMAVSIVDELEERGAIDQDALAQRFAENFEPGRGYGAGAYKILSAIEDGTHWRDASRSAFGGMGSLGNGAAMRVAPLGAFFSDDIDRCIDEARKSAEITHAHEEGIAGAIAVAVGAALGFHRHGAELPNGREWLACVRDLVPPGTVRKGIETALALPASATTKEAADVLGNGAAVTASDTVPFCLWIAAWKSHDYAEALWQTVSVFGDIDTTCAIVGGIASLQVGLEGIPDDWRRARERLPLRLLTLARVSGRPT